MPTYTQIHIHAIFSVKDRIPLIDKKWRGRLYNYIISIIQKHNHKVLSIGGTDDHIHILFGFRPTHSVPDLMREVKRDSSEWINKNQLTRGKFEWQRGYGAFSYSKSQIDGVVKYIEAQEKHHTAHRLSFIEEYKKILDNFGVEYDERYIC